MICQIQQVPVVEEVYVDISWAPCDRGYIHLSLWTPAYTPAMVHIAICCLMSNVPTVIYFPYIPHLVSHLVLYFLNVVHNTKKTMRLPRVQWKNIKYFILATSINSNYYKPFKLPVLLMLYWNMYMCSPGDGVSKSHTVFGNTSCCMSFLTPPLMLYSLYSTRTATLNNTYISWFSNWMFDEVYCKMYT